jgi:hypothetical protein
MIGEIRRQRVQEKIRESQAYEGEGYPIEEKDDPIEYCLHR